MKRLVLFLSFVILAIVSYGQEAVQPEPAQSYIVREGDRYTVNGVTYYNSTEFRGYLKNTNPEVFAQYDKGYKLGMAGWGLLSYGVAFVPTSFIMILANQPFTGPMSPEERKRIAAASNRWFAGWLTNLIVASGAFAVSIPMLGIGYHKMHKSVDAYNVSLQPVPQTYWSIQVSGNGIGVAYNF